MPLRLGSNIQDHVLYRGAQWLSTLVYRVVNYEPLLAVEKDFVGYRGAATVGLAALQSQPVCAPQMFPTVRRKWVRFSISAVTDRDVLTVIVIRNRKVIPSYYITCEGDYREYLRWNVFVRTSQTQNQLAQCGTFYHRHNSQHPDTLPLSHLTCQAAIRVLYSKVYCSGVLYNVVGRITSTFGVPSIPLLVLPIVSS